MMSHFLNDQLWADNDPNDSLLMGDIMHLKETIKIIRAAIRAAKKQDASEFLFLIDRATGKLVSLNMALKAKASRIQQEYGKEN